MEEELLTPGAILRNARIAKGLRQADIANQLRLAAHLIEALETNDYARFPASVYVRGYLRSYGALLEIDPGILLSTFDQITAQFPTSRQSGDYVVTSISKIHYLHRSKRRFAYWMSWFISIVIIVLLGAWWYGQHHRSHFDVATMLPQPEKRVTQTATVIIQPNTKDIVQPDNKPVSVSPSVSTPTVTQQPTSPAELSAKSPFHETFILESKKPS